MRIGCGQRPLEAPGGLAFQHDAINAHAGLLLRRQALTLFTLAVLKAHIGPAFLLLAQYAFALLLAQQLLCTRVTHLLGSNTEGHDQEHQHSTTAARTARRLLPCSHNQFQVLMPRVSGPAPGRGKSQPDGLNRGSPGVCNGMPPRPTRSDA
ncbi:hypothetical protein D3C81_1274310 [compost metagenome]